MTNKEEKEILKLILATGVEPTSSNIYRYLIEALNQLPVEASKLQFRLSSLKSVLENLSKKWDKEIDRIIGL